MNHILIATHGKLAEGFYEGIRFFHAQLDNVSYLNAYVDHPHFEEDFLAEVRRLKGKNLIVFTDILGGSVNQIAMRHMSEYGYQLVSGTNLAVLLEAVFQSEDIGAALLTQITAAGQAQLVSVRDVLQGAWEEEREEE